MKGLTLEEFVQDQLTAQLTEQELNVSAAKVRFDRWNARADGGRGGVRGRRGGRRPFLKWAVDGHPDFARRSRITVQNSQIRIVRIDLGDLLSERANRMDTMDHGACEYPFAHSQVVLVVPPFSSVTQASLGCHLLQACARAQGIDVRVLYGNLIFAAMIGPRMYCELTDERLALDTCSDVMRSPQCRPCRHSRQARRCNKPLRPRARGSTAWRTSFAR